MGAVDCLSCWTIWLCASATLATPSSSALAPAHKIANAPAPAMPAIRNFFLIVSSSFRVGFLPFLPSGFTPMARG
jgi:hypothetical protein